MARVEDVAKGCIEDARRPVNLDMDFALANVQQRISWFVEDVFELYKNINETSVGSADRFERIIDFERRTGIGKSIFL